MVTSRLVVFALLTASLTVSSCIESGVPAASPEDHAEAPPPDVVAAPPDVVAAPPDVVASPPEVTRRSTPAAAVPASPPVSSVPPCVEVTPRALSFGAVPSGLGSSHPLAVEPCGAARVGVTHVWLEGATPDAFAFSQITLPAMAPFVVVVSYVPPRPSSSDVAVLAMETAAGRVDVALEGMSVPYLCPTAAVELDGGTELEAPALLSLSARASRGGTAAVAAYRWGIDAPEGALHGLVADRAEPGLTYEASVAGHYRFFVDVLDSNGVESCRPASLDVVAKPSAALHVELVWEGAADLDLHLLHPLAVGADIDLDAEPDGWFDPSFDTYWFNPEPDWALIGPKAGPALVRQGIEGGPEVLSYTDPWDLTYRIGVHAWHAAEPVEAFIRIYRQGEFLFESATMLLHDGDFWDVAALTWATGEVSPTEPTSVTAHVTHPDP